MRPVFLLTAVLVAGYSAPASGNGQGAPDESRSRPQAEVQEGGYVPRPNSRSDERPWASAFVNHTLETAGVRGTRDVRALSWLVWGVPLRRPAVGAVAVLDYGHGRGHVGFVEGTYEGMIVLLGGDQGNEVNRTAFAPQEITAYRWPAGRPIPASAYDLPSIRPKGAPDANGGSHRSETRHAVPAGNPASNGTIDYRSSGGEQSLRVQRLADDRIRFRLQNQSCRRTLTGTAYEIYPGDVQIDAEAGIGYPGREYFFWADSLGSRGVSIRLSVAGPPRARATGWGYPAQCPQGDPVMHADARPQEPAGERAMGRPLNGDSTGSAALTQVAASPVGATRP
jgi:uncharacterized protein (TIGR02594 family)